MRRVSAGPNAGAAARPAHLSPAAAGCCRPRASRPPAFCHPPAFRPPRCSRRATAGGPRNSCSRCRRCEVRSSPAGASGGKQGTSGGACRSSSAGWLAAAAASQCKLLIHPPTHPPPCRRAPPGPGAGADHRARGAGPVPVLHRRALGAQAAGGAAAVSAGERGHGCTVGAPPHALCRRRCLYLHQETARPATKPGARC